MQEEIQYLEENLSIKCKDGAIRPLRLNDPQKKLLNALERQHAEGKPMRAILLKARQMGFSTLCEGLIFARTATRRGVTSGIVAHKDDATNNLFAMSKLYYECLPEEKKPERKASNARELVFDGKSGGLKSAIRCMTAAGKGIGRSDTFQNLHISEIAFWPGDQRATLIGLLQAVPDNPDTLVVIESTANGYDHFKALWDAAVRGENAFTPVFCGWQELPDYRRPYTGFTLTAEEQELARLYSLDNEQLAWRRWCIANNCGGDAALFRQEYPLAPHEAFLATGRCIFDQAALAKALALAKQPAQRGNFTWHEANGTLHSHGFFSAPQGCIKVYEPPQTGVPYVIGCDTAGDGSDSFVAQVLDNRTGAQAAVLRHTFDEDVFAREIFCLGQWYNWALIGIETNFSTYPVRELERLGYPRQYVRETLDTYTHRLSHSYGFRTTGASRAEALGLLVREAREQPELIRDETTLREMLSFVRSARGRAEAMAGEHDDCVMALAIAHAIRCQQSAQIAAPPPPGDDDSLPAQLAALASYGM